MLPIGRHRRRRNSYALAAEPRSRGFGRLIVGVIILLVVWFVGKSALALFSGSAQERAVTLVQTEGRGDVDVSLQGEDTLNAESGLKLYPGDSAFTRGGSYAVLSFFDGTLIRLDEETEIVIEKSKQRPNATSLSAITLEKGRAWIMTPDTESFSGSITRTVDAVSMQVDVPSASEGLIAQNQVFFLATAGAGAEVTIDGKIVIVGEGQHFGLSETAKRDIEGGADPYQFRDPISQEELSDPFIAESRSSLALIVQREPEDLPLTGSGSDAGDLMTITSPSNDTIVGGNTVLVAGRVSTRVKTVDVNGYKIAVEADGSFSQELTLPNQDVVLIEFEALDDAGLVIAQASRTIERNREPPPSPSITAPGGSGDIVTITEGEVDITGTAPPNTNGIIVNDYRLQLFQPNSRTWSYIASTALSNLVPGENVFSIRAIDESGQQSAPAVITIIYAPGGTGTDTGTGGRVTPPPESPTLQNNAPLEEGSVYMKLPGRESFETTENEVLLEGNTSANTATVSVNGYQLQLYEAGKTFWNYIASEELGTMKAGTNTYRIVARDSEGRVLDILEYTITYAP